MTSHLNKRIEKAQHTTSALSYKICIKINQNRVMLHDDRAGANAAQWTLIFHVQTHKLLLFLACPDNRA